MKQYWSRVLGAWFLLSLAGRMMKSAEAVLRAAQEATSIDAPPDAIIESEASANGNGGGTDTVSEYVDNKYDG